MRTILQSNTSDVTRLFSNLEANGNQLNHQPGSILGSTALVAGTTIGAGVLALPTVTLPSGVIPSTALLIAVWLYALVSGLLIAEVTLNAIRQEGRQNLGLLIIAEKTLGPLGAKITSGAYLFLHYALLVAYTAQGGKILISAVEKLWGVQNVLPTWLGTVAFTFVFGGIMYLGRGKFVEQLNNAFVTIVLVSFFGLLISGITQVNPAQFVFQDWRALPQAVSVMLVALFYHNVVPVVVTQLEGDARKIRCSIIIGSAIPLFMFLAWNAVILGSVNPAIAPNTSFDPLQILHHGNANEWLGVLISLFSEFAIATSFIGFVYGLLDFFQGVVKIAPLQSTPRLPIYSLILFPPMSLGAINPSIFLSALDYAGTFSISIIGGIVPAAMAWKQRAAQRNLSSSTQPLVGGGKLTLLIMISIAIFVIIKQILEIF